MSCALVLRAFIVQAQFNYLSRINAGALRCIGTALRFECLGQDSFTTLHNRDGVVLKEHINDRAGPVVVGATGGFGRSRLGRFLSCHAEAQVAVLDFRGRNGNGSNRGDRSRILARSLRAAIIGAGRGGVAGGGDGDGNVTIAQTGEAAARGQGKTIVGCGRPGVLAALKMHALGECDIRHDTN